MSPESKQGSRYCLFCYSCGAKVASFTILDVKEFHTIREKIMPAFNACVLYLCLNNPSVKPLIVLISKMDLFVLVFMSICSHICVCIWIWSMKEYNVCMKNKSILFSIKPLIIVPYFCLNITTLLHIMFVSVFVFLMSFHVILITCNVCCAYVRQPLIALIRSKSFLARQ